MDEYEATFKVVVTKSPLRDGWYARVIVSEGEDFDASLTGYGSNALMAAQRALAALTNDSALSNATMETALLRGTRMKRRELPKRGK